MEVMIGKWIQETIAELNLAKKNIDLYKMDQMRSLRTALEEMKDKLLKRRLP